MKNYTMTDEEIEYLKGYDITQYDRPSLTADMAVFAILSEGDSKEYRKDPKKRLGILMIRRGTYPYRDCYGLPRGFARVDESIEETAFRETLTDESGDAIFIVGNLAEKANQFLCLDEGKHEFCNLGKLEDGMSSRSFLTRLLPWKSKPTIRIYLSLNE